MDLMLQAAITAVVAVGVNKFMKTNPPQSPEELPAAPSPAPRQQTSAPETQSQSQSEAEAGPLLKVPSAASLQGQSQSQSQAQTPGREDEREYKIVRDGNFAADSSQRSRTWFKHPTW
jgi:ABC-type uncharacterized transport system involved in gliding motility auxiliary subunit